MRLLKLAYASRSAYTLHSAAWAVYHLSNATNCRRALMQTFEGLGDIEQLSTICLLQHFSISKCLL